MMLELKKILLAEDNMIHPENLPEYFRERMDKSPDRQPPPRDPDTLQTRLRQLEQKAILEALQCSGYNKTKAMEQLGLSRRTFYKRIREMGLD